MAFIKYSTTNLDKVEKENVPFWYQSGLDDKKAKASTKSDSDNKDQDDEDIED